MGAEFNWGVESGGTESESEGLHGLGFGRFGGPIHIMPRARQLVTTCLE